MTENQFLGKPEIYWIGLTAITGVATLTIIFLYTLYTRRMMKLAEENRRADIIVVLSLRGCDFGNYVPIPSRPFEVGDFICGVRNIGRGPAATLQAWHNEVSDQFTLGNVQIFQQNALSRPTGLPSVDLLAGETIQLTFSRINATKNCLFIIQAVDIAQGKHQLQILTKSNETGVEIKMVHAMGDSTGERLTRFVARYLEILRSIENLLDKYENR